MEHVQAEQVRQYSHDVQIEIEDVNLHLVAEHEHDDEQDLQHEYGSRD